MVYDDTSRFVVKLTTANFPSSNNPLIIGFFFFIDNNYSLLIIKLIILFTTDLLCTPEPINIKMFAKFDYFILLSIVLECRIESLQANTLIKRKWVNYKITFKSIKQSYYVKH